MRCYDSFEDLKSKPADAIESVAKQKSGVYSNFHKKKKGCQY
jgi:hypothetical protein